MSNILVTDVGRAVARSALMPRTAVYFLEYFRENIEQYSELLSRVVQTDDGQTSESSDLIELDADLGFVLFHLCFCSPEFGDEETAARRFLPYPMGDRRESERAVRLEKLLVVQPWDRAMLAVNAADMCTRLLHKS